MRVVVVAAVSLLVIPSTTVAQSTCLDPAELVRLDSEWENALLTRDAGWLGANLSDGFIWVHNHASATDTKANLLERAETTPDASRATRSRTQSDVEVRVVGSTGLVTGFTLVDRGPRPTMFNFMRTYIRQDGRCLLLGNHTMEVPRADPPAGAP